MRQPKFKMGEKIAIEIESLHPESGVTLRQERRGTVCGVFYDPKSGTHGAPFYYYHVLLRGAKSKIRAPEERLTGFPKVEEEI